MQENGKERRQMKEDKDDDFFSEEDDELFGEHLLRFLVKKYPNPDRIGCPDTGIIRDIAFRRKVTPENLGKVTSHILKCSECIWDALAYVEEYRKTKKESEE